MTFSQDYAFEVLQSRRARRQRALFWAKVLSFVLMILVAVTLRSEPQLRVALFTAVTDVAMQVMGKADGAAPQTKTAMPITMPAVQPEAGSRIRVNRPEPTGEGSTTFKRVSIPQPAQPTRP